MTAILSDESALLAAVLDAPDDDSPRLVYADWLEENAQDVMCAACVQGRTDKRRKSGFLGSEKCRACYASGVVSDGRAERSEFIRVQLELARSNCDYGLRRHTPMWPCRFHSLRQRERKLLTPQHAREWFAPWGLQCSKRLAGPSEPEYRFRPTYTRGFVSRVECTLVDWQEHGAAIVREHPVEFVLTEQKPDTVGDEVCWVKYRQGIDQGLPLKVFDLLRGGRLEQGGAEWETYFQANDYWMVYPTASDALAALSDALLRMAKEEADGTR